ncbi:MAG: hypothetical protein V4692_03455 [Bdellovibrionota bacterium]
MRNLGLIIISVLFAVSASAEVICDESSQPDGPIPAGDYTVAPIKHNQDRTGPKCMFIGNGPDEMTTCTSIERVVDKENGKDVTKIVCTRDGLNFLPSTVRMQMDCSSGAGAVVNYSYQSRSRKKTMTHQIKIRKNRLGKVGEVEQSELHDDGKTPIPAVAYMFTESGGYTKRQILTKGKEASESRKGTLKAFPEWSGFDAERLLACCNDLTASGCDHLQGPAPAAAGSAAKPAPSKANPAPVVIEATVKGSKAKP